MLPVSIVGLFPSPSGYVVLLKNENDTKSLPVVIGAPEAQSIAFAINKVDVPRPMTHDLFVNFMRHFSYKVDHVEICKLKDNTFFANLFVRQGEKLSKIDSRPSDALALALRTSAPIYVHESVMEQAGVVLKGGEDKSAEEEELGLTCDDPVTILQKKLQKAVKEENYEEAASLRDQIKEMTSEDAN